MKIYVKSQGKCHHLTIVVPTAPVRLLKNIIEWVKDELTMTVWILNSLEIKTDDSILHFKTPKEMYD